MDLRESLRDEPVSNLHLRQAVTVGSGTVVREVVGRMRQYRLGCVVVVDADGRAVGTFTEDQLIRLLVTDSSGLDATVDQHLAERWACVALTDPIARVLDAMQSLRLRFVCIVDDERRPVGLTGQKGMMEFVAEYFPRQVMVQRVGLKTCTEHREGA